MKLRKSYIRDGQKVVLEESQTLFVIRTKNGFNPHEILSFCLEDNSCVYHEELDSFPEASVWIFKISKDSGKTISEFKAEVNSQGHPQLVFIGSVWIDVETKRYQLYTENLFIKFKPEYSAEVCLNLLEKWDLKVKIKLEFSENTFFIEPRSSKIIDTFSWTEILNAKAQVESCEPELIVKRKSFKRMKSDYILDPDRKWASEAIGLDKAWQVSKGKGVKVCIIDDGIDVDHPAFNKPNKIIASRDVLRADNAGAKHLFNSEFHGTACASVVSSSDYRSYGIAPESQLIVVRSKGLGSILESEAIYWGVKQGADIISCSWGPTDGDIDDPSDDRPSHRLPKATRLAIDYAVNEGRNGKGTLVFFAAGNGSEAVNLDSYASYHNVLAIGSVNKENKLSKYSDFGTPLFCVFPSSEIQKTGKQYETIYGITVADRIGLDGFTKQDYFSQFGGTSASAPGAAGVAALALSVNPNLTAAELKRILIASCKKIGDPECYSSEGYSQEYGFGLLCADLTIQNTLTFSKTKELMKTPNTPKGYALHIGVDIADPKAYSNFPALDGCVKDAEALQKITKAENFDEVILLANANAKRSRIKQAVKQFASSAKSGDLVVISYAGHGSQIVDEDGDEETGFDQVLITYDGMLIDDEIYEIFLEFAAGVRVVWIGDSCHSDSQVRFFNLDPDAPKYRQLNPNDAQEFFDKNKASFRTILDSLKRNGRQNAKASIWSMYACKKTEYAAEIKGRGLFTSEIEKLYYSGNILTVDEANKRLNQPISPSQNPAIEFFGGDYNLFKGGAFKIGNVVVDSQPIDEVPDIADPVANSDAQDETPLANLETTLLVTTAKDNLELIENSRGIESDLSAVRVANSEVNLSSFTDVKPWDSAYQFYHSLKNKNDVDFIEPDITSDIYKIHDEELQGKRSENKYLESYPDPEHDKFDSIKNPFIWHLGDEYSQLRTAFEQIKKRFRNGEPTLEEREELPLICHIDTGILDDHPATPKFLDYDKSRTFRSIGKKKDITDYDSKTALIENQGHGQGTISILAGNYVNLSDTDNSFKGYYGAFPFARVMSLKISENVVLLSGNKFARALRYAVDSGCDVVTMSMAGAPTKAMVRAINYAYEKGVIVVSAAGNSWVEGGRKLLPEKTMYPARFNRVIGVTGATLDYTPYLVKENENWRIKTRDTGGKFMQTCFGPEASSRTNMAAYTPNVQWASNFKNNSFFDKSGGGTSSATPQVAAAAAMWLYEHRESLNQILNGKRDWQRVEMARHALFSTAKKSETSDYNAVFGNGMLKALDALEITPQKAKSKIKKEAADDIGWSGLDDLFNLLRNRSFAPEENDLIKEMVQTEIAQLTCIDPAFFDFTEESTLDDMGEAILQSDKASDYLKSLARQNAEIKLPKSERSESGLGNDVYVSARLKTDNDGEYHINAEGCAFELIEQKAEDDALYAEYELVVSPIVTRSVALPKINFLRNFEASPAVIVTDYDDGTKHYQWIIEEEPEEGKRGFKSLGLQNNAFVLDVDIYKTRGKGRIKRFFIKIFRTVKDEALSSRPGLIAGHISNGKFTWVERTAAIDKKIEQQKRTLLLLHGTFSSAENSFANLLERPEFFSEMESKGFGKYVLAYNMSTIRSSVETNAKELHKALKPLKIYSKTSTTIEVIASSRGCLVARRAFGNKTKMALIAGTHLGTPLASAEHLSSLVNRVSNLAAISLSAPVFTGFLKGMSIIVKLVFKAKGIADQSEESLEIRYLAKTPLNEKQKVFGSNFEPDEKMLKQLGDAAVDKLIFRNRENDGVTLTDSALINEGQGSHEPFYRVSDGGTSHFGFFRNDEVIEEILKHF
ncbi:S8 family serine peptidase [Brumimicrobium mesophilum]|uniref:S8 family serine peptidase n=1 Tax=Brumimicrobium mesophilum TaxID=392717 RepID=UPI000D143B38|nr:S8 family serine peptidase [Brumimicrobium mesophilum]